MTPRELCPSLPTITVYQNYYTTRNHKTTGYYYTADFSTREAATQDLRPIVRSKLDSTARSKLTNLDIICDICTLSKISVIMRLLHRTGKAVYTLTKDLVREIPPYAILSHTWGNEYDEVTSKDFSDGTAESKSGYLKIRFCGEQAASDGLEYFWIDTCCIDKSSSAELSEAINSMFRWYQGATKCYVYLSDVSSSGDDVASVEFFSSDGGRLGDKKSKEQEIHMVTGVAIKALQGHSLSNFCVADRMSWASKRRTTRKEDEAYCLMGIFGVYMPMIYGEGSNAWIRLEKEI
jgi:hypothetical protein